MGTKFTKEQKKAMYEARYVGRTVELTEALDDPYTPKPVGARFHVQELMMNSSFMGVGSQVVVWLCLWNMTILKLSNKYIVYH